MGDLMQVCKAGAAGCCSVILIVLGVFIAFPGITLLAVGSASSDTAGHDDVYEDTNRELQVAGAVMLIVGAIMILIAIGMCCYVCRKMHGSSNQGMVLSTNPSQTTATVTTGYSAVPTKPQSGPYPPQPQYPAQNQYPPAPQQHPYAHIQHPPPQQQYPPQQQQFPPPQQYPPQQYQQRQGAPAHQYPGTQNYDKPPSLNPEYSAAAQPSAPFPTLDRPSSTNPSAPPQHQMSFKR